MHLSWSAAGKASQRIAKLGSYLVSVGCMTKGSIPSCDCHWSLFLQSLNHFFLASLLDGNNSGQKFWRLFCVHTSPLRDSSKYWMYTLQIPTLCCWVFWMKSLTLTPRSHSHPRSLRLSRGSPNSLHSHGLLGFSTLPQPIHDLAPFSPPFLLSLQICSFHLPPLVILFPLLWLIEVSLFGLSTSYSLDSLWFVSWKFCTLGPISTHQ